MMNSSAARTKAQPAAAERRNTQLKAAAPEDQAAGEGIGA